MARQSWDPRSLIPLLAIVVVIGAALLVAPQLVPAPLRRVLGAGATPLGRPPSVSGAGAFAFMAHQAHDPSRPVAYDPCRPIKVRVNPAGGPPDAIALTQSVMAEVGRATGLRFEYAGTTADRPSWADERTPTILGIVRARPVLVSWATEREVHELKGDVAGIGGSLPRADYLNVVRYVTGSVTLDAQTYAELEQRDGAEGERAIMLHEFGHLVGLAHVSDQAQLMYADNVGTLDFATGDRKGLAALGAGSCA